MATAPDSHHAMPWHSVTPKIKYTNASALPSISTLYEYNINVPFVPPKTSDVGIKEHAHHQQGVKQSKNELLPT
jgi:hypothetical protein